MPSTYDAWEEYEDIKFLSISGTFEIMKGEKNLPLKLFLEKIKRFFQDSLAVSLTYPYKILRELPRGLNYSLIMMHTVSLS